MVNKSDIETDSSLEEESFARRNLRAANGTRNQDMIKSRPNASSGYWLCVLLAVAMATHYYHPLCENVDKEIYEYLTVAAIGMCIQSLCFFIYLSSGAALFLKLILSLIPGICTFFLYNFGLNVSWPIALTCGFFVTFSYQNTYVRVMKTFPNTFSLGEASILIQGLMLFGYRTLWVLVNQKNDSADLVKQLNNIVMYGLSTIGLACSAFVLYPNLRKPYRFYSIMTILLLLITCFPSSKPIPIIAIYSFLLKRKQRIFIILFYFALAGLTICTVAWQLRNAAKASTRVRKIFHLLILFVYIPGLLYECELLFLASCVALAILIVLESIRVMNMPPFATYLERAFAVFADEKDVGALALTPFCLLIGCSLPIWINPCSCGRATGSLLATMSGILAVGVGDTAASVIGSRVGRTKWRNSSRSLEGTIAFIVSVLLTIVTFYMFGFIHMIQARWFIVIVATVNTALVEALTDQIDNLVLPLDFTSLAALIFFENNISQNEYLSPISNHSSMKRSDQLKIRPKKSIATLDPSLESN